MGQEKYLSSYKFKGLELYILTAARGLHSETDSCHQRKHNHRISMVNGPLNSSTSVDKHGRQCMASNCISIANIEALLVRQYNQDFPEQRHNDQQFLKIASDSATLKD